MRYRQDTRLKSNRKKLIGSQGVKVSSIVFDKEITQEWGVKTTEPNQILPYTLKRLCLSRMCQFWHQMKFFYFENYQETTQDQQQQQQWVKQSNLLQDWEESVILARVTAQRVQQSKHFLKVVWKITRQRLMSAMNKIKHHSGVQDESSLQLQEEKLNSYMRFLKLQENKHIDIAVQTVESVIQKNTKKKLLNAFLNIRQRLKEVKRSEIYRDKIKVECFVDIVMRSIKRENVDLMRCAFDGIELRGQFNRRRMRHLNKSKEMMRKESMSDSNSLRSNKINTKQASQNQSHQKDTVNKLKKNFQNGITQSHQKSSTNNNQQSTIKRQVTTKQKHFIVHDNNRDSENRIKSISSHEQIIQSQYYYGNAGGDRQSVNYALSDYNDGDGNININSNNKTSLPTRRTYRHHRNVNNVNNYVIEQFQERDIFQNHQHDMMHKKTARTPSRVGQTFYHTENLQQQELLKSRGQYETVKYVNSQHQLHIPVTQRVERHFHGENYEEQEEQSASQQQQSEDQQNVHQQICVIRNGSSTPNRKPDRYEKIPIISNNIDFRQYFLTSNKKSHKIEASTHSTSYYERQCCEGCQYCTRLKKMNDMMALLQKERPKAQFQTEFVLSHTVNVYQKVIQNDNEVKKSNKISQDHKTFTEKSKDISMRSKTEQISTFPGKISEAKNVNNPQIIIDSSKASSRMTPQKVHSSNKKESLPKYQRSSSSILQDIKKSVYSKGHSEKKTFSRKPMY